MAIVNIHYFSHALGMNTVADVIVPQAIDCGNQKPLPVLWLLHGMFGNHADWTRRTAIERYVAPYGIAVVMPSAYNSMYVDMAHGGKFYTYISQELPQLMRSFFNFSDQREANFIAGLSMGGAGSMLMGLANPQQYSAIGCLSAGAINRTPDAQKHPHHIAVYGEEPIEGTYKDPYHSARQIILTGAPAPRIYHACGKDDFLLASAHETRDFFQAIPGNPFDYTYEEDKGAHTWSYWDTHIQHFIQFLNLPETKEYC